MIEMGLFTSPQLKSYRPVQIYIFSGMPDLLLIAVLDHKLGKALKWEKTRDNKLFPHLYGFFNITDAEWVKPLQLGANGKHKIPHLE